MTSVPRLYSHPSPHHSRPVAIGPAPDDLLLAALGGPAGRPLPGQQPVEIGRIGAGHLDYLRPAGCPAHQRHRITAHAERPTYLPQPPRSAPPAHRTRTH